jgi:hypothetical protein
MQFAIPESLLEKIHYSAMLATALVSFSVRIQHGFRKILLGDAPLRGPFLGVRCNDEIAWGSQARQGTMANLPESDKTLFARWSRGFSR